MLFFLILLFLFGLIFGSFSSVVIYRLRSWEKWIFMWRSKCPKCENTLGGKDLIPLISYLSTAWKCRYCKTKISLYYPLLEMALGIFFVLIWYFLVDYQLIFSGDIQEMALLEFWLFVWFFTFIYTVYDILYLEIPENILLILVVWIFLSLWVFSFFPDWYNTGIFSPVTADLWSVMTSLVISGISLAGLYYIMLGGLEEKYDVLIFMWIVAGLLWIKYFFWIQLTDFPMYSALIGVLVIYGFFFFQILISQGKWMWAWDLRIAIVLWLLLWYSYWHAWLMLTYLTGSIIWLGFIAYSKLIKKEKEFNSQIPFWPFLTIGLFMTLFFQDYIDIIIKNYFLL